MKTDEISQPFETEFGYHIIKRIAATPVPANKNDETFMYHLKQDVLSDSRAGIAKEKFIAEILPKVGLKKNPINTTDLWNVTDSSLLANTNVTSGKVNEKTALLYFNDKRNATVADWIQYLRNSGKAQFPNYHESYNVAFPGFIAAASLNNYRARLENFNADFKNQLDEFKEGNLLFEIMERRVWGKASSDSAGLLNYYNQHQKKYLWEASAEAVIFSCSNEGIAHDCIQQLNNGKSWHDILNDNSALVQADSGRYELAQIPVLDRTNFTSGLITAPVVNKNDGTTVFAKIIRLYPGGQQRSFDDARGLVLNDYQNFVEEKWIEQLKKQYPIKIDEKVLQKLLK